MPILDDKAEYVKLPNGPPQVGVIFHHKPQENSKPVLCPTESSLQLSHHVLVDQRRWHHRSEGGDGTPVLGAITPNRDR